MNSEVWDLRMLALLRSVRALDGAAPTFAGADTLFAIQRPISDDLRARPLLHPPPLPWLSIRGMLASHQAHSMLRIALCEVCKLLRRRPARCPLCCRRDAGAAAGAAPAAHGGADDGRDGLHRDRDDGRGGARGAGPGARPWRWPHGPGHRRRR